MNQARRGDRETGTRRRFAPVLVALVLAFLFSVLLITPAAFFFARKFQIQARLDAIRESGDPICIADLEPPPVDLLANATTFMERMESDGSALIDKVWPILGEGEFDWSGALPAEEQQGLVATFAEYPALIQELERVHNSTQFVLPLDYTQAATPFMDEFLPWIGKTKNVSRVSSVYAKFLATQGKHQQAADVCLNQLRFCRHQDTGIPLIIGFQINMACRRAALDGLSEILQVGELPESTHLDIEAELAQHDAMLGAVYAFVTERAFGIQSFAEMPFLVSLQVGEYLDVIELQLSLGTEPSFRVKQVKSAVASPLVGLAAVGMIDVRATMDEFRERIRRLRVLNALQQLPSDTKADAVDLNSLEIPVQATINPHTGRRFRIERGENRWFVGS